MASTTNGRRELLKILFEGFSTFPQVLAKTQEIFIAEEQALNKVGMNFNSMADPSLIPRLVGSGHPELIGKYVLYTVKVADLLRESADPAKLTIEQKREKVKQFLALSEEVKSIGEEIQKVI
ncbi:MAG: hypothetical protein WB643_07020 [Candidatus Bathyarchaeia archaeon]